MARHTFVVSGGLRVEIQPSKTEPGAVLLSLLHSSRDVLGCVTIAPSTAAVLAQALAFEAVAAENSKLTERAGDACGCHGVWPGCGMSRCAGREISEAKKQVRRIGPALVQAYADTNGIPPGGALPVVDLPQVAQCATTKRCAGVEQVGA